MSARSGSRYSSPSAIFLSTMKLGNAKELILLDEGQQIHNHDDELETGSLGVHVTVSTDPSIKPDSATADRYFTRHC